MCRICVWDFGLACLDDPHRLEKLCLPKRPSKTAQAGAGMGAGVLPYSGGENRTQAHTGGTAGTIRLCCLLVFGISSFSGPIPKVLFFVYAAQFLYRRLHPSIPLIMFYRTLLGDIETLSFPFHRCDRMCCLKISPNRCCYGVWYCFSLPRLRKPHTSPHSRSRRAFLPDFRT